MGFHFSLVLTICRNETRYSAYVQISYELATYRICRSRSPSVHSPVLGLSICDDTTLSKKDQDHLLSVNLVGSSGRHRCSQLQSRNQLATRLVEYLELYAPLEGHLRPCDHGQVHLVSIQKVCVWHRIPPESMT